MKNKQNSENGYGYIFFLYLMSTLFMIGGVVTSFVFLWIGIGIIVLSVLTWIYAAWLKKITDEENYFMRRNK